MVDLMMKFAVNFYCCFFRIQFERGTYAHYNDNIMSRVGEREKQQYDRMVKLLLIGNSGVGKSSILLQYSDKKFVHNYYNTIGVDYRIKYLNYNGLRVKLQWDTAGQDRFKTITSSYYRGADAIIIVYDITDRTSFEHVKNWLEEIQKFVDEKTVKYIVGNKSDLEERRQVSTEEATDLTNKLGIPFRQTSARLATNVQDLFEDIIDKSLSRADDSTLKNSNFTGNANSNFKPEEPQKKEGLNIKQMMQNKKKEEEGGCCSIY